MLEQVQTGSRRVWFCNNCAHDWIDPPSLDGSARASARQAPGAACPAEARNGAPSEGGRFRSIEDLIARTHANREELATLAEIGALNALEQGHRRDALWQIERAVRPAGELFEEKSVPHSPPPTPHPPLTPHSPLPPMTFAERVIADYSGTGLTIGPHPMSLRREELAMRGVLRAIDLPRQRHGRRVRVAGTVITRQRPGTAKGFVFLTLEDETGISNIIVRPDLFARDRLTIVEQPFLLVEGTLQNQDGVTSVRADRMEGIAGLPIDFDAHDFY
jgi:error-prone DNA polymerase